jgi:hypothetical protein
MPPLDGVQVCCDFGQDSTASARCFTPLRTYLTVCICTVHTGARQSAGSRRSGCCAHSIIGRKDSAILVRCDHVKCLESAYLLWVSWSFTSSAWTFSVGSGECSTRPLEPTSHPGPHPRTMLHKTPDSNHVGSLAQQLNSQTPNLTPSCSVYWPTLPATQLSGWTSHTQRINTGYFGAGPKLEHGIETAPQATSGVGSYCPCGSRVHTVCQPPLPVLELDPICFPRGHSGRNSSNGLIASNLGF